MTVDTHSLPPKMLGFWVRMLRQTQDLSQDALAVASGLTIRTIQRVEAGAQASLTTRRCLARGLGYPNVDVFDDPSFIANVTSFLEAQQAAVLRAEEARYPDHLKLETVELTSGAQLAELVGRVSAWVFNCDDDVTEAGHAMAATLFDMLRDYLDIWEDLSHSNRLETHRDFSELLAGMSEHGVRAYHAIRKTSIVGRSWADKTPMAVTIGYICVLPEDQKAMHLMVPKWSCWA